jgi:NADPH2:quinone reductase
MKAVVSTAEGVRVQEREVPIPATGEVLVRVEAIGMNRIDLLAVREPRNQVIGMEWAGKVAAVGPQVDTLQVGDRVMCTGAGAYAEYATADAHRCVQLPASVSSEQGAAMLLGLQTMHDALVTRGKLQPGNSVLIQGAASCMGLIGMQMAKLLGASMVLGTSRNARHRDELSQYSADAAVDSSQPGWYKSVLSATSGIGADITVDLVSGEAINECIAATAIGGTIVNVGRLAGKSASFDFNLHALRRIAYVGVTFRTRSRDEIRELNRSMREDMLPRLEAIRVPLAARFDFGRIDDALKQLAEPDHMGKVLLAP